MVESFKLIIIACHGFIYHSCAIFFLATLITMTDQLPPPPDFAAISQSIRTVATKIDKVPNIVELQNSVEIIRLLRGLTEAVGKLDRRMTSLETTLKHQSVSTITYF